MKTLSGQLHTGEMCGGGTVQLLDGVTILVGAQCSVSQLRGSQPLHPPPGSGKNDLTSLSQPSLDLIGKGLPQVCISGSTGTLAPHDALG